MHVNENKIASLPSDTQNLSIATGRSPPGNLQGRNAVLLTPGSNQVLATIALEVNNHSTKIDNITSKNNLDSNPNELKNSSKTSLIVTGVSTEKTEAVKVLSTDEQKEIISLRSKLPIHQAFAAVIKDDDGGAVAKILSKESFDQLPAEADLVPIHPNEDGSFYIFNVNGEADHIKEVVDEKGQSQSFEFVKGSEEFHAELNKIHTETLNTFFNARLESQQEKANTEEEKGTKEKDKNHSSPLDYQQRIARTSYDPLIKTSLSNKDNHKESFNRLSDNPQAIIRQVIEARTALEIKKESQERTQKEKERRIEAQEERRELRLEGYKKDEIKNIQTRHEILSKIIQDEEAGRPPTEPVPDRILEGK
jgi:hypothetical protein